MQIHVERGGQLKIHPPTHLSMGKQTVSLLYRKPAFFRTEQSDAGIAIRHMMRGRKLCLLTSKNGY